MTFSSSLPAYNLDHHHHPNWHQLQQQPTDERGLNFQLPPLPKVSRDEGSIRPNSMVDRARLANLPLPQAGLNCPRCNSTNTKFCYFNNYNLTQPRHFCKTCRRYWTRGGALRSVPVGGGCRRNEKSKSRSSKSPITNKNNYPNNSVSTDISPLSFSSEMTNHFSQQVPLMAALQKNFSHYGPGNFGGFQPHIMVASRSSGQSQNELPILSSVGVEGWKIPILAGSEQPVTNLLSCQGEGIEASSVPVKVEENRGSLNLSRQFLGVSEDSNQYWGENTWAPDFLGQINTSFTTQHL